MLGLIKKDILTILNNFKQVFIILIVIIFLGISMEDISIVYFLPVFEMMMLSLSVFSYDEYNKWDMYAITLPTGRTDIVKTKYISNIVLLIGALVFSYFIVFGTYLLKYNINFGEVNATILGSLFAILMLQTIMYPLIFKFGVEKGRIGIFIGVFLSIAVIGLTMDNVKLSIPTSIVSFITNYYIIILIFVALLALFISYQVSRRIYLKKNF